MSDSAARTTTTTRFKITRLEDRIVPSSIWASIGDCDNNSDRGGSSKKHGSSKKKHGSSKKKHGSSKKGYKNVKCKK